MKRKTFLKTLPAAVGIIPFIGNSEEIVYASPKQGDLYFYNDYIKTVAKGLYLKTNKIIRQVYEPMKSDYAVTGEPFVTYQMGFVTPDDDYCKNDNYKLINMVTGRGTKEIYLPVWAIENYWEAFIGGTIRRLSGWTDIKSLEHMSKLARKNNLSIHWRIKPTIKYNITKDMFELYSKLLISKQPGERRGGWDDKKIQI